MLAALIIASPPAGATDPGAGAPAWPPALPGTPGARLHLWPALLDPEEAARWMRQLTGEIPWTRGRVQLFGRALPEPRLSCWLGDPGCTYTYSGQRREPVPWPPGVAAIRERVEAATGLRFNGALANLYRDGADGVGWHADDEPELGDAPVIASLSLGATRRLSLRRRDDPRLRRELSLSGGSLLVMAGRTQALWKHQVPKTRRPVGPRINLSFRQLSPRPPGRCGPAPAGGCGE